MTATWQDLSKRIGTPPLGEFLGVETDKRATPSASADVFGNHGKLVVLERGLGGNHLDWVIHLRATEVGVNEGFTRLRSTVVAIAVGLVVLTVGIGYLLSQMWRPLINVRKVAERDPLTGLYNRHHVGERISRTMDSARRGGHDAVVIMLDIDNFKELNDDLGHIAGDQALADISTVLANQTRASDMAVRWGGDEFLVVLRLPIAVDAAGAVERIRARAEETLKDRFRGREGLGVTAGFAVSPDGDVDIDALIAAADAALVDGKWLKKGATYGA
jgi:diguanylate cyclase (GGDEF)-like protein